LDKNVPLTEALFYILLATRKPNHGYGIIQEISEMTQARVNLGPGTLYGAINSMLEKGWIELYSEDKQSRKKKEYLITQPGKEIFFSEAQRLKELVSNAKKMGQMEGNNNDSI
jgi:DNA-binding PadR family transcriptional regulator